MHQVSGVTAVRFHLQTHRTTRTFLVDSSPRAFFQLMLLPPMIRFFEQRILFFPKKRRRRKTLLFFTRQYRPRVVLFNFFFTTVDSCRTDSRTHIRSNALMLGSSLSSSLSGEDRGARVACCCPRGLRNSSPDADLVGEVATVEKRSPPIGRLVIRRSVSTVHDLSRFTHIFAGAGRRRRRQQHRYTGSCIKTRAALRIMIHCAGHESYKL